VRISLGKQTTQADIDFALSVIPETVGRLRQISPLYHKQTVG
jgi:cysteine sulfinate desulfinase/cysteine desulfurase-like protein